MPYRGYNEPARRRIAPTPSADTPQAPNNPLAALEWLSPEDAEFLADAIEQIAIRAATRAVQEQPGAARAYAWAAAAPPAAEEPPESPPYVIELLCRPVEFLASCVTAPTTAATFDVLRSVNQGASWDSMLVATPVMAAGAKIAVGSVFKWEIPLTRTLTTPGAIDAYPMQLRAGDMVHITVTGGTGMQNLSSQLRTQRIDEHARGG
jgi:hypothetical protein